MPLYPARNLQYINLKDSGCKIDGVTDDSVAFTAAYTAASTLGMALFHPGGTLLKGNDTLLSNVPIIGVGSGVSVIKLKAGANTDLFSAQTSSINLAAVGNTGILGTLSRFQLKGLTLDGNSANQTAGPSYPIRFYGYDFRIEDLEITGGYSGGWLSDWNYGSAIAFPSDEMEANMTNIKIHDNNGIGFQFGGPHDTRISNMIVFNNGSHNIHFAPNANGILGNNIHPWGAPNVTGVCNWLIEIQYGCNFVNCISDGAYGTGVAILGTSVAWQGEIYTGHAVGVQLGQQAGQTPFPGQINQSAGVTTAVQVSGTMLNTSISGCPVTSINVQNEVDSFIQSYIYQTTGSALNGSLASSTVYNIHVNGLTADGTVAKSGGMQMISSANPAFRLYSNTGATLFHVDGFTGGTSGFDVPGGFHITAGGGLGVGTSANSNDALLVAPSADNQVGIGVYPHSATQSSPLIAAQNSSFSNVFTVDLNGNIVGNSLALTPGSVATPSTGSTITTSGVGIARVNPSALCTGIILQAGTQSGQSVIVENRSAYYLIMAASGTSNVASGTSDYIAPNTAALYAWDSAQSLWYRINPPNAVAPLALYADDITVISASTLTAGVAYLSAITVLAPVTLTQMRCQFSGTPTGNVDMGIYDSTGVNGVANNLLAHTGAIAATTGIFTQSLTANLLLAPGVYWLAWLDTVADSIFNRNLTTSLGVHMKTSATNLTVLPSVMSTVANASNRVAMMALRSGSWS